MNTSNVQRALIGGASLGALVLAGWWGTSALNPPALGIDVGGNPALRVDIKDCSNSWLSRKVEGLSKHCHLGNLEVLKAVEDEAFHQYEAMAIQWPQVFLSTGSAVSPKEIKDFMWPEEDFFRRTVNGLQGSENLRSLTSAQDLYVGRLKEITRQMRELHERVERNKAYAERERARQESPYAVLPDPAAGKVAIIGKSGPFNIYDIQPKDDLDALKYISGGTVYDPILMAPLIPVVSPQAIKTYSLTCEYLCADSQGNIVGRTRVYVDDQPNRAGVATR